MPRGGRIEGNLRLDPSHFKGDDRPVEQVIRDDARCVCQWLNGSGLLPNGWVADLPSESQRESRIPTDFGGGLISEVTSPFPWLGPRPRARSVTQAKFEAWAGSEVSRKLMLEESGRKACFVRGHLHLPVRHSSEQVDMGSGDFHENFSIPNVPWNRMEFFLHHLPFSPKSLPVRIAWNRDAEKEVI